ncbi:hypothetical protein DMB65_19555 [Flavobacterium cheongpyeongense]|uniref:Uncharacterized protein n=1 Tax=Flavobacterium cheongpyeongense TaxID=2212651 RepID=A0A2V4BJC8_9FLAO|nr:hypothetical protein [Flavobacterium cheongpyeongense]PXY39076.1 hypothetical protein DMB65_19555 [Flavobacterium cheongpyeongense]
MLADVPFSVGGLAKATFIGAASSAVTYGIGSASTSLFTNFYSQAAFSAVAHGTFQGSMTAIQGGKFWSGFAAGALSSIAASAWSGGSTTETNFETNSSLTEGHFVTSTYAHQGISGALGANNVAGMIAFGTVSAGAGAALTGGNFWQGAVTGLVVSGLNHAMHKMDEAFAKHKFDKEIDNAYGSSADSPAPANETTLNTMAENVPTLKNWHNKSGNPKMYAQPKYAYAPSDGISEAKTFAYDTDNYKSSTITFFKSSFASYRTLAHNMLHEFGHAYFNYTGQLAPLIAKYGDYSKKPQAYSEVYAFKFAFQYGGIPYSNNGWYQVNNARIH